MALAVERLKEVGGGWDFELPASTQRDDWAALGNGAYVCDVDGADASAALSALMDGVG
jgi:hypothetical protein